MDAVPAVPVKRQLAIFNLGAPFLNEQSLFLDYETSESQEPTNLKEN